MYIRTKDSMKVKYPMEDEEFLVDDCWECNEKAELTICLGEDSKDPDSLEEIAGTTFLCEQCLVEALILIRKAK